MRRPNSADSSLWVCWQVPETLPPVDEPVLSFLAPALHDEFVQNHTGMVVNAREASLGVRSSARDLYLVLVAKIGTVLLTDNVTFRQALTRPGAASLWWYHPVSFKDCESDPAFHWIDAVLTVREIAQKYGTKHLILVGAPWGVAQVLRSAFAVEERQTHKPYSSVWLWLKGVASRCKYAVKTLRQQGALRGTAAVPSQSFDVMFSGFWDWSVRWDDESQSLSDRYFKRLPDELKSQGTSSLGWLSWLDPNTEPGKENRRLEKVLAPLKKCKNLVLLQSFLRPVEILKAISDFRPLATFLRVRQLPAFREVFQHDGLDYYPLLSRQLLSGFLNSSVPHCELVALATQRACTLFKPKVFLSFLEHYPFARAHYEGVRQAGTCTINYAIQHASYNHDKTFICLQPTLEFKGEPDGCAVPHPEYVCAAGTLGRNLFLECGYEKERVLLTGSPRYDHILSSSAPLPSKKQAGLRGRDLNLLMVLCLEPALELEMVDAACAAARGLAGIRLLIRNHPFSRIEHLRAFAPYKHLVELRGGGLDEDVAQADLILFTYSTAAEEAFLQGKPVWQWRCLRFNGSALAEVVAIPQFGSVVSLRQALLDFRADPGSFIPGAKGRQLALERLFYRGDGHAAQRVSEAVLKSLH